MDYILKTASPLGEITLLSDGDNLTGLWLAKQKYHGYLTGGGPEHAELDVFKDAVKWLDIYFSGLKPDFTPPIKFIGSEFRKEVWNILLSIPYGKVMTYGEIADVMAKRRGLKKMSAQAVGGAVGHNPVSIIVPCHRVVGAGGNLTGFGGGIDKKIRLLKLENVWSEDFYVPKKGTAL